MYDVIPEQPNVILNDTESDITKKKKKKKMDSRKKCTHDPINFRRRNDADIFRSFIAFDRR